MDTSTVADVISEVTRGEWFTLFNGFLGLVVIAVLGWLIRWFLRRSNRPEPAAATQIAGKMALTGCSDVIVRGVYGDVITTMVIALEALRDGHFQLWQCENSSPIEGIPPGEKGQADD